VRGSLGEAARHACSALAGLGRAAAICRVAAASCSRPEPYGFPSRTSRPIGVWRSCGPTRQLPCLTTPAAGRPAEGGLAGWVRAATRAPGQRERVLTDAVRSPIVVKISRPRVVPGVTAGRTSLGGVSVDGAIGSAPTRGNARGPIVKREQSRLRPADPTDVGAASLDRRVEVGDE
jgi:hypothetical protein